MPRFLVLDDAVHRQATNLGTSVEDLQQVLRAYHGTARSTFANWAGLGAEAFEQFDARFQTVAQGLVTSLVTLRTEVDAAGVAYDNNERSQQAAVAALRGLESLPVSTAGGPNPPAGDGDGFWDGVGDFFGGLAHPFREMWDSVWQLFTDPGEWLSQTWDGIYDSVAFWNWDTFVETWKETGKDFVAWDEWGENWPRALGITITNVGLTVLTFGVGALIRRFLLRGPRGKGNNGNGDGGDDSNGDDGDGGGDDNEGADPPEPDFGNPTFDDRKLSEYALNPEHPRGGNKARVIQSRTGLGRDDAPEVKQQILEQLDPDKVQLGETDQYGTRWTQDVQLTGPDGTMTVRTAWIVDARTGKTRFVSLSFPPRTR